MGAFEGKVAFRYCSACGEEVYTYTVLKDEGIEVRCSACGLPLELDPGPRAGNLDCIAVADDDRLFRTMLTDLLIERGLALKVLACEDGAEFLAQMTGRIRHQLPTRLAILDILMHPLDGTAAAIALRALEKGFGLPQPIPILFLSGVRVDEGLLKQIELAAPALYLNKGVDATPERLADRIQRIVTQLLRTQAGPKGVR